jgi:DNA-binding response OmpR family regulator
MSAGCCPLCGSAVISADLVLFPARHVLCRGDQQVYLSGREWALFEKLHLSVGRPVSRPVLIDWIYGLENDEPLSKVLDVFVMKLRRKVKVLQLEVKTHWGFGVSLEFKGRSRVIKEEDEAA